MNIKHYAVFLVIILTGCGFLGKGKDGSKLVVDHKCDVQVEQNAAVQDMDDAMVVESIDVQPDCTTTINFEQRVGTAFKKRNYKKSETIADGGETVIDESYVHPDEMTGEALPEALPETAPELVPETVPEG